MDNSQHTPGPWKATWHNGGRFLSIRSGEYVGVARVNTTNIDRDANALLIAAAPELLSALIELSSMYARTWDRADGALVMMPDGIARFEAAHAAAQAAIAAATGSTHE